MVRSISGIVFVALVATAGDALWYELGIEHRMIAGVVHGALLLAAVGGVVGFASGRPLAGVAAGATAGLGGAIVFYALAALTGGLVAMVAAWTAVWLLLATFDGRFLRTPRRPWSDVAIRGLSASVLAGLAFFAVLRTLWGAEPEGGRNYLVQLGAWLVAWAPGLLALTWQRARREPSSP